MIYFDYRCHVIANKLPSSVTEIGFYQLKVVSVLKVSSVNLYNILHFEIRPFVTNLYNHS